MARKRSSSTPESIAKRIAEGYGQGIGKDYRPWLKVQDFPSRGVVHRPLGSKTGRVHQCFSDLELKGFLIFDVLGCIIDIRQQFPLLPLEETLEIADQLRIRHPRDPATRHPVVMTTDFLLKLKLQNEILFHARTAKYAKDLKEQRVRNYFKIEHLYWLRREIEWGYFTELDIPRILADNAALIHPFHRHADLHPLTEKEVRAIASYLKRKVKQEELPLKKIVSDSDQNFKLLSGKSFAVVCHLISRNLWNVDLHKPIALDKRLVLL